MAVVCDRCHQFVVGLKQAVSVAVPGGPESSRSCGRYVASENHAPGRSCTVSLSLEKYGEGSLVVRNMAEVGRDSHPLQMLESWHFGGRQRTMLGRDRHNPDHHPRDDSVGHCLAEPRKEAVDLDDDLLGLHRKLPEGQLDKGMAADQDVVGMPRWG